MKILGNGKTTYNIPKCSRFELSTKVKIVPAFSYEEKNITNGWNHVKKQKQFSSVKPT